jgi:hypothetical protein
MASEKLSDRVKHVDEFTAEVADPPHPEIADLAAIGRAQLKRDAEGRTAWAAAKADEREQHWQAMHEAAVAVLGKALVDTDRFGYECPIEYRGKDSSPWQFHLRPFGAAELLVRFECVQVPAGPQAGAWQWVLDQTGMGGQFTVKEPPACYRVCQQYAPEMNPTAGQYEVAPTHWHSTDDLAKAVALCQLQTDGYKAAVKEAARLNKELAERPK